MHLQAIGKHLSNTVSLRCWNHTFRAVKFWLRKHGACTTEIPAYVSHVRELINQCNLASYQQKLKDFQLLWSKPFYEYYMNEIHPEVKFVYTPHQSHVKELHDVLLSAGECQSW